MASLFYNYVYITHLGSLFYNYVYITHMDSLFYNYVHITYVDSLFYNYVYVRHVASLFYNLRSDTQYVQMNPKLLNPYNTKINLNSRLNCYQVYNTPCR